MYPVGPVGEQSEAVRRAFARNFEELGEVGAAVAVHVDGRPVVDIWAGVADADTGTPWQEDTLALVFSTTKGWTAMCALLLWERGKLDIDAPVAEVWPEFAAAGKESVTTRQLLSHQAGLPAFDDSMTIEQCHDLDLVASTLAAQAPRWTPGTAHGYHAITYGWLVGEVIRRVDDDWLERVHKLPGFVSYHVVRPAPDRLVSVTAYLDADAAHRGAEASAEWVGERLGDLDVKFEDMAEGEVVVHGGA